MAIRAPDGANKKDCSSKVVHKCVSDAKVDDGLQCFVGLISRCSATLSNVHNTFHLC